MQVYEQIATQHIRLETEMCALTFLAGSFSTMVGTSCMWVSVTASTAMSAWAASTESVGYNPANRVKHKVGNEEECEMSKAYRCSEKLIARKLRDLHANHSSRVIIHDVSDVWAKMGTKMGHRRRKAPLACLVCVKRKYHSGYRFHMPGIIAPHTIHT